MVNDPKALQDGAAEFFPTVYDGLYMISSPADSLSDLRKKVSSLSGNTVVRFPCAICEYSSNELFTALDMGETGIGLTEGTCDIELAGVEEIAQTGIAESGDKPGHLNPVSRIIAYDRRHR